MKRIRLGVFGVGRGIHIAESFMLLDCDIVALCDFSLRFITADNGKGSKACHFNGIGKRNACTLYHISYKHVTRCYTSCKAGAVGKLHNGILK